QIAWSHLNVTNSMLDFETLLSQQLPDGRVPEEIFWSERSGFEEAIILLTWNSTRATDITQMPLLPFSLRAIYNQTKDLDFVKKYLPKLMSYYLWWHQVRSVDGDNLVAIIHSW